jgi:hypothetical protein
MPQKSKGKKASQAFDAQWSDSDWSGSEDKDTPMTGQPRQRPPQVAVDKDKISELLDTFVKHGIAVKGEVSEKGDISFVFRSAPGKLVPVATDKPMLPAIADKAPPESVPSVPAAVTFKPCEGPDCHHYSRDRHRKHYNGHRESTRRRSHRHNDGAFARWIRS